MKFDETTRYYEDAMAERARVLDESQQSLHSMFDNKMGDLASRVQGMADKEVRLTQRLSEMSVQVDYVLPHPPL